MNTKQERDVSDSSALSQVHAVATSLQERNVIGTLHVKEADGSLKLMDSARLVRAIAWACDGKERDVSVAAIADEAIKNVFDGITPVELSEALILGAVAFVERDPSYGYVAARLLFKQLYREVTGVSVIGSDVSHHYSIAFVDQVKRGVKDDVFDVRLLEFDLDLLSMTLVPERDRLFDYMGIRTLYERYLTQMDDERTELPQMFWMRVAMGLALNEQDKNKRAIEFYHLMSLMHYVPSTPTLLHSSLKYAQLSSCFLMTINDDLHHIFKALGDNAQLSKWSGGVANDWTNVRATGARVKSIKTESQGTIPFIKINSDVTASINRSGKRRAATVVYLEAWHYDIEDFLDLRRNTGDDRRRTHDLNTANWIPDLFMKRLEADADWTLFSPHEVPDLHDLYGKAFETRYAEYEQMARDGKIGLFKVMPAKQLWRKMLSRLFETGHPWITFKDACNIRSPQDHVGVIHSSNLCTEITLNTSTDEVAVCNIGSVNLSKHVIDGKLDYKMLASTVETAMRMLDNVIDINYYPVKEAKTSNMRHRPIGIGLMGFQDALYELGISFDDDKAREFADTTMEYISYNAILTSSKLAKERGTYGSYKGSKWDRGLFPVDTLDLLEKERGQTLNTDRTKTLDWAPVYDHVKQHGMRNSNTMAIAPTATISTIAGCFPCIEPIYKNLYVKANMSGEFTIVNKYLIADLKERGLWNADMLDQLKYHDGNVQRIAKIPDDIKARYKEAFEIDPEWLMKITVSRMKWIDQSQSHNIFLQGVSGKKLHDVYMAAWKAGLKTTYYMRSLGATQIEKSTLDAKKFGFTQKREYATSDKPVEAASTTTDAPTNGVANGATDSETTVSPARACNIIDNEDCESCQ